MSPRRQQPPRPGRVQHDHRQPRLRCGCNAELVRERGFASSVLRSDECRQEYAQITCAQLRQRRALDFQPVHVPPAPHMAQCAVQLGRPTRQHRCCTEARHVHDPHHEHERHRIRRSRRVPNEHHPQFAPRLAIRVSRALSRPKPRRHRAHHGRPMVQAGIQRPRLHVRNAPRHAPRMTVPSAHQTRQRPSLDHTRQPIRPEPPGQARPGQLGPPKRRRHPRRSPQPQLRTPLPGVHSTQRDHLVLKLRRCLDHDAARQHSRIAPGRPRAPGHPQRRPVQQHRRPDKVQDAGHVRAAMLDNVTGPCAPRRDAHEAPDNSFSAHVRQDLMRVEKLRDGHARTFPKGRERTDLLPDGLRVGGACRL